MAEIVVGIAASHTPQVSTGADMWRDHGARDRGNPRLLGRDGEYTSYDELTAAADPKVRDQLTDEIWAAKYDRANQAIAELARQLTQARPDVAVVIGDDQGELFKEDGVPTFALFLGEELYDEPKSPEELRNLALGLRAAQWAYHGNSRASHRTEPALAAHLAGRLAAAGFDLTVVTRQRQDRTLGHAFTFPRYRLGLPATLPIVPLFLNTYYPPNVPSARRCYELGCAVSDAIASWDSGARVAVITSGGLSHFVIDEELDQRVLAGLSGRDVAAFGPLPAKVLRSGTSEILNWVTAAAALRGLTAKVIDYVPGYRSEAGTGTGMAFAYWH